VTLAPIAGKLAETTDLAKEQETQGMSRQQRRLHKTALIVVATLLVLIVAWSQRLSPPTARATNAYQDKEMTDAITVALDVARSRGLAGDPDTMYIARGTYWEFAPPGTVETSNPNQDVWVVWLKAKLLFRDYDVRDIPVEDLYIYIDADTGLVSEILAVRSPVEEFYKKPWAQVNKNDIGKFPIPKLTSGSSTTVGATATPVKPSH
jgi:hypothetical protein